MLLNNVGRDRRKGPRKGPFLYRLARQIIAGSMAHPQV